MPDGYLTFDDGRVQLGDDYVDGVLKSMNIRGEVRFDEVEQEGLSGKTRVPCGWEDAAIVLVVELLSDADSTCYEKLEELNALFKNYDRSIDPLVYDIRNAHANARGVWEVYFSGLESNETDEEDVIQATLAFTETAPAVVEAEKPVIASDQAVVADSALTAGEGVTPDKKIMVDVNP